MRTWICIGLLLSFSSLSAQNGRNCATREADSLLRARHPKLGSLMDFEAWLQRAIAEPTASAGLRDPLLTLPVIVHIIHNGEEVGQGSNISQAQVMSQFDVLNEDFRRLPGTPGFNNHPDGADIEIEFCPATIAPDSTPLLEPGIHRVKRQDMGWSTPPYSLTYIDSNIKPLTYWDPDRYLNIWVVEINNDILGFAQFPNASTLSDLPFNNGLAETDGIAVRPTSFGRVGNLAPPYHLGRTCTHEVGHWLGLWHLSGDGNCSVDDFCTDTPESDDDNDGCPVGHMSCGSLDMIENYLDLTDDACMNIFTQCQKTRMRTVLDNSPRRGILANSNACTSEVPPATQFVASQTTICAGQSVFFTDLSLNGPQSWLWTFPGGNPASSTDPSQSVTYSQPGVYDVSLQASNAFGSTSRTITTYIMVNDAAPALVFAEDFESGIPNSWTIDNPDQATTWEVKTVSGTQTGSEAAWINLYFYAVEGARDALITPAIDLSGKGNLLLSLDYAYRRSGPSEQDSLLIWASTNGGQSFPHLLYGEGEDGSFNFATGPTTASGSFSPVLADDWCFAGSQGSDCIELDLNAFKGETDFHLKFESVSDFGNNIYLDNIQITGTCDIVSIEPDLADRYQLRLYPNPSSGRFWLELKYLTPAPVHYEVHDLWGRTLLRESRLPTGGSLRAAIDVHTLPQGPYLLRIAVDGQWISRRFLKQ